MLVPSIEPDSSDALIEPSREVIMISDDSPRPKRRRVVHDDSGHFRPLPSYDQVVYSAAPHAESHLIPVSSTQPRGSFVQSPRNPDQLSQGLLRDTQQSLTSLSGERIPIYDAPAEPGYVPAISSRRIEFGVGSEHEREVPRRQMSPPRPLPERGQDSVYVRRPVAEDARMVDRGHVVRLKEPDFDPRNQTQRPLSPCFPVSSRGFRSYEMGRTPVYADQPFLRSPQSRLEPPLSIPRDGINAVAERPRPNFTSHRDNTQRFEELPARPYSTVRHTQDRSPVQYMERPM
jgi:hypothetical protein